MAPAQKTALVLGVNGQDGSFLAEILCARGYRVVGMGRQPDFRWPKPDGVFSYRQGDVADTGALATLLDNVRPGLVFHMAVTHGPAGFDYDAAWQTLYAVNVLSLFPILRHMQANPECRLVYAGSIKMFGALREVISETSPRIPIGLYGVSKNAAQDVIDYYVRRFGVGASVLYLLNHESERRPVLDPPFFSRLLVDILARALIDPGSSGEVETLDFFCDWGDAREYMDIAVDVGERGIGQHYLLGTGRTWYARDLVSELFEHHGLDHAAHVRERHQGTRRDGRYSADVSRLHRAIGRIPQKGILEVLDRMLALQRSRSV